MNGSVRQISRTVEGAGPAAGRAVWGTVATPAGALAVVADVGGEVLAAGFAPLDELVARWAAVRGPLAATTTPGPLAAGAGPGPLPDGVLAALEAYGDGDVHALGAVPVRQAGPPFLQDVWTALQGVGPGRTVTYTELAARAGRPAAVRAAASGCARNLVAPFVPCHRVVRTDGSLGGYAYGVGVKRALLAHEAPPG